MSRRIKRDHGGIMKVVSRDIAAKGVKQLEAKQGKKRVK